MEYSVKQLGPMQVMGIELRTTNENWQSAKDIGPFWGRFYREGIQNRIPNQVTGEVLGLYCEYEKDHTKPYTFVIGCQVSVVGEVPKGLVVKKVPAAKYAVFEIDGKYPDALVAVWQWVWEGHLRRTYTGDFEVYPVDFDSGENPKLKLYVAIS